jgi:hypothetical protein
VDIILEILKRSSEVDQLNIISLTIPSRSGMLLRSLAGGVPYQYEGQTMGMIESDLFKVGVSVNFNHKNTLDLVITDYAAFHANMVARYFSVLSCPIEDCVSYTNSKSYGDRIISKLRLRYGI